MTTGSCLCGTVSFSITGPLNEVAACHCGQCRKTSGHYWAAFSAPTSQVQFTSDSSLVWFQSSSWAKRGFCNLCGSSLFYQLNATPDVLEVAAGTIDALSNTKLTKHIFVADKGDYYNIGTDDAAQFEQN